MGEGIMECGKKQGLVGVSLKDCWRSCSLCCSNLLPRWTYAVQSQKKQTVCGRLFINHIKRSFSKPSLSAAECTTSLLVYGPKGSSVNHHLGLKEAAGSGWGFSRLGWRKVRCPNDLSLKCGENLECTQHSIFSPPLLPFHLWHALC